MTGLYTQWIRVGREQDSRERDRQTIAEKGVVAWVINLTIGENIYDG
jgi:hypothetical protein